MRKEYAPKSEDIARASERYEIARTLINNLWTGPDLDDLDDKPDARRGDHAKSIERVEKALSIYVAVVILDTPKRHLAAALRTQPHRIRNWCRAVENWRGTAVVDTALLRAERALSRK